MTGGRFNLDAGPKPAIGPLELLQQIEQRNRELGEQDRSTGEPA